MKRCILCDTMTHGSVGAAGLKWPMICQPCKDKEDKALADQLKGTVKILGSIFNSQQKRNKCR